MSVAACGDGRHAEVTANGTPVSRGTVGINYSYFKYFDGVLKGFYVENTVVESCSDA